MSRQEKLKVMKAYNEMINRVLELSGKMIDLADKGDEAREDNGCGALYGMLRDSAYKLQKFAKSEKDAHIKKGKWG